jgi:hypothetical protein
MQAGRVVAARWRLLGQRPETNGSPRGAPGMPPRGVSFYPRATDSEQQTT